MKKFLFVPATVVALAFAFNTAIARAADKNEDAESKAASVEEKMDNLVKQGPGVHNIKKDDKGRVQSLIVVGQSRISTVLGAAKGKEIARKKAEQSPLSPSHSALRRMPRESRLRNIASQSSKNTTD